MKGSKKEKNETIKNCQKNNSCDVDNNNNETLVCLIKDGNEEAFYGEVNKYHIEGSFYPRVPLMYIEDVKNLTLKECTLTHSGFWTVHLVGCRDVLIDGIRILNNLRMANCDGIDPDHCQNVRISKLKKIETLLEQLKQLLFL